MKITGNKSVMKIMRTFKMNMKMMIILLAMMKMMMTMMTMTMKMTMVMMMMWVSGVSIRLASGQSPIILRWEEANG